MPATFLLRAFLVDPLRSPLGGVPVRPWGLDVSKNSWTALGEVQFTNDEGHVELEITGSPAVAGPLLGLIALRHEETGFVLAEQWSSITGVDPVILDFGEIRVSEPSLATLSERTIAGVPWPIATALVDAATIADLQAQLAATQDALASAQGQIGTLQGQLGTAQGQLGTLQNQLATTQGQLATTQGQLATTQGQLATTQGQLATAQGALGQLEATHAATLEELAQVSAELEALQGDGAPTSLESVVDAVGEQLQATQGRLVANGSPFQLGRVSLSLKVVPTSGTSFGFASLEELATIGSRALSTLELDFAQTTPAATEPTPDAAVPSLVGLTEPAARRRLAPLGLGARVVHQAIADDGDVVLAGRVLKQVPAAGAAIPPGQTVTLVLGKALAAGAAT